MTKMAYQLRLMLLCFMTRNHLVSKAELKVAWFYQLTFRENYPLFGIHVHIIATFFCKSLSNKIVDILGSNYLMTEQQ